MRIIHEIDSPMQVSAGINPYINTPGMCGYNGIRVELLMCTSPSANFSNEAKVMVDDDDPETIEIEGPLEMVLDALKQAVSALELSKKSLQKDMGPLRSMICPNCLPPEAGEANVNASHTWECMAKWSDTAQKQLEKDPSLKGAQNKILMDSIAKIDNMHDKCGGAGCPGCKWTGKKRG